MDSWVQSLSQGLSVIRQRFIIAFIFISAVITDAKMSRIHRQLPPAVTVTLVAVAVYPADPLRYTWNSKMFCD